MKSQPIVSLTEEEKLQRIEEMRLLGFDSQMRPLSQIKALSERTTPVPIPASLVGTYYITEEGVLISKDP